MNYHQLIIIKFGGGTGVILKKKLSIGLLNKTSIIFLTICLVLCIGLFSQSYKNTPAQATSTLTGNNTVIAIKTTDGLPVNSATGPINYSADGNVILFGSSATNLPDSTSFSGLYIYNIKTDTTSRVDISTNGTLPNNIRWNGVGGDTFILSETGRYVSFASQATNLVDGSTQPRYGFYIRDTQAGTTSKLGAGYTGEYSDKWDRNLALSNDGQFALISSRYLANNYPNNYGYAFGENVAGTYTWTSLGTDAYYEDAGVGGMSCDGSFVVIKRQGRIELIDLRRNHSTTLIAGGYDSASPIISCNGRYVLYATRNRTDIPTTPIGMNTYLHLVRYDRLTGERLYTDSNSLNIFSTAQYVYNSEYYDVQQNIFNASIGDTGDIVFNYKSGTNTYTYMKHLSDGSGTLESIARTQSGSYVNVSNGAITRNGQYIFFQTDPYNLGIGSSPAGNQIIRAKTNI